MVAIPYTYLIGWPDQNKWYYGVRYAKNCHPDEFWNSYKTSSNTVKDYVKNFGDPQVQIIRKTFTTAEKARLWESSVLKRLDVVHDEKWLNKTDNKAIVTPKGKDHPNYGKFGKAHPSFGIKKPKTAERLRLLSVNGDHPFRQLNSKRKELKIYHVVKTTGLTRIQKNLNKFIVVRIIGSIKKKAH